MELRVVLAALRRSWIIVVACAAVGAVAAGALTLGSKPFEARVVVSINTANQSQPDRYMQTKLQELMSGDVRDAVAKKLHLPSASLESTVGLSQQIGADLLEIAAQNSDPVLASRIAKEYATQFIAYDSTQSQSALAPTLRSIQSQIDDDNKAIADAQSTIADARRTYLDQHGANATLPPDDVLAPAAAATLITKQTHLSGIQTTYNNLAYATSPPPQIVAVAPAVQLAGRSKALLLGIGLVLGVAIGALIALVRGQLAEVVIDGAQVEELLGTDAIGTIDLRTSPAKTRAEREDRNAEVFGEILARTRVAAGSRAAAVTVVGVGEEHSTHVVVAGLITAVSATGADRAAVAFVDASRIFARPMFVDACRESDVVVVVVDVDHDRSAPLRQLGLVLDGCNATILPVVVRGASEAEATGIASPTAFAPPPRPTAAATPQPDSRPSAVDAIAGHLPPAQPAPARPAPSAPSAPAAQPPKAPARPAKPAPSAAPAAPATPGPAPAAAPPRWRSDRPGSVPTSGT